MSIVSTNHAQLEPFMLDHGFEEDPHTVFYFATMRRVPGDPKHVVAWGALVSADNQGVVAVVMGSADGSLVLCEALHGPSRVPDERALIDSQTGDALRDLVREVATLLPAPSVRFVQSPSRFTPSALDALRSLGDFTPRLALDMLCMGRRDTGTPATCFAVTESLSAILGADDGAVCTLREDDVEAVKGLMSDCEREEQWPSSSDSARHGRAASNVGLGVGWRTHDNRLISIALVSRMTEQVASIGNVYTSPPNRRKGLARCCVAQLTNQLHAVQRRAWVQLFVERENPVTLALYRALGYEVVPGSSAVHAWELTSA